MLFLEHFGLTDAGKVRENNEDSLLLGEGRDPTLFAVADGIGGFEAGEVASSMAVEAMKELEPGQPFESAIREANRRILAAARGDEKLSGMGTTVVALRFSGSREEQSAEIAHIGDSRAYLLKGGELSPITEDHSLVAELVRSGDLTRAQAAEHPQKNLITRALGANEDVEVDTTLLRVEAGDRLLLCSDGLTDMVPEDRIASILSGSPGNPEPPARRLLSAALDAGGADNITIIIADVKEYEPRDKVTEVSGDTSEMEVMSPPSEAKSPATRENPMMKTGMKPARSARKRKRRRFLKRVVTALIRAVAVLLVVAALLSPVYLWGSNRYFLAYNSNNEVVIYRGLPYKVGNTKLNQEWKRTNLKESDIAGPYKDQIRNHKLYTKDKVKKVVDGLGSKG